MWPVQRHERFKISLSNNIPPLGRWAKTFCFESPGDDELANAVWRNAETLRGLRDSQ